MFRSNQNKADRKGGIRSWLPVGLAITLGTPVFMGLFSSAPKPALTSAVPAPVTVSWQKVEPHLDRLDQQSAAIAEKHLSRISAFVNDKKKRGAKEFAEWAFSWRAKFNLVVGNLQGDDGARLRGFLQEKFDQHIFRSQDLQNLLESVIAGVGTECAGAENDALVQLRADIAQDVLFKGTLPALQTDQAFQDEYRRLAEELLPKLLTDLKVGAAGQATNLVLSEVVSRRVGPGLAEGLGFSGSGFWSSAGRFAVVFGVGMAAWWALDHLIDWLMDFFGYGPAAELATKGRQFAGPDGIATDRRRPGGCRRILSGSGKWSATTRRPMVSSNFGKKPSGSNKVACWVCVASSRRCWSCNPNSAVRRCSSW